MNVTSGFSGRKRKYTIHVFGVVRMDEMERRDGGRMVYEMDALVRCGHDGTRR